MTELRPHTKSEANEAQCPTYCVELQGCLDMDWADWFLDMQVSHTSYGNTRLIGPVPDQAALHGLLIKIRDLGLPLLSLYCVEE